MRPKSRAASLRQQQRNLQRIAHSANAANVMLKQFTDHPCETYQLLLKLAGQIAFETSLAPVRNKTNLPNHTISEFTKLMIDLRAAINARKYHLMRSMAKKRRKHQGGFKLSATPQRSPSPRGRGQG